VKSSGLPGGQGGEVAAARLFGAGAGSAAASTLGYRTTWSGHQRVLLEGVVGARKQPERRWLDRSDGCRRAARDYRPVCLGGRDRRAPADHAPGRGRQGLEQVDDPHGEHAGDTPSQGPTRGPPRSPRRRPALLRNDETAASYPARRPRMPPQSLHVTTVTRSQPWAK